MARVRGLLVDVFCLAMLGATLAGIAWYTAPPARPVASSR